MCTLYICHYSWKQCNINSDGSKSLPFRENEPCAWVIPIKDASSLPEEFSKPSKIQKHIIISEKQKTKQKYYQQNIESHTEKKQKLFKQEQAKSIPIYILFV